MKYLKYSLLLLFVLCFDTMLIGCSDTERIISESYIVKEETLNIVIKYPSFSKESEQTNDIVREFAINAFNNSYNLVNENLTVNIDYEIATYNDELVSVIFCGSAFVTDTAYPTDLCYAITIDLDNECIINWNCFFDNELEILEAINNEKYRVVYGGMKAFTNTEIYQRLSEEFSNESTNEHLYFYIRDGEPYLIITALGHVLGDYSIIGFNEK